MGWFTVYVRVKLERAKVDYTMGGIFEKTAEVIVDPERNEVTVIITDDTFYDFRFTLPLDKLRKIICEHGESRG